MQPNIVCFFHILSLWILNTVSLPQAMHLVYRALEKEPVPALLPPSLVPLSKRKKSLGSVGTSVPGLPASPPPPKDSLRSTPSHGSMNSLNSAGSLSPKHTLKSGQVINTHLSTGLPTHMRRRWEQEWQQQKASHEEKKKSPISYSADWFCCGYFLLAPGPVEPGCVNVCCHLIPGRSRQWTENTPLEYCLEWSLLCPPIPLSYHHVFLLSVLLLLCNHEEVPSLTLTCRWSSMSSPQPSPAVSDISCTIYSADSLSLLQPFHPEIFFDSKGGFYLDQAES